MAKKELKQKSIEETLWESANKLRGSVEPSEYKHVVLSLIFLKFASDKFEEHRQDMITKGQEKYIDMPDFYGMANVFYLDEISRWSYIIANAKQSDIALRIDTALHHIEKNNKALTGALPDNYFSRLSLDVTKLASLLDTINDIDTLRDKAQDIVGRVYEYFLSKFALAEGKGKGEFYTPKSIVNLIAEMIEPYKGIIYDPACGSGGMFVQSIKFIENHHGNKKEISIYGQEYTNTTYKLAKMNLAIRGIAGNLGEKAADTFADDQHKDLKADYIMANPPFNQKDWRAANELVDDPRWIGYDVPPKSNANYGWILNMVSKLSDNGVAGFILANGALSGGGEEYKIRRKLIENNLVEAIIVLPRNMFYTTDISVTLWILNKNKKAQNKKVGDKNRSYRDRAQEILFMDLRQMGEPFEKKFTQFSATDIQKITTTYHLWQSPGLVEAPASTKQQNDEASQRQVDAASQQNVDESSQQNVDESSQQNVDESSQQNVEAVSQQKVAANQQNVEAANQRQGDATSQQNVDEVSQQNDEANQQNIDASQKLKPHTPTITTTYQDIPEYCYSATLEEVEKKDFSLVPSKYIEFVNRDENIDFDKKMKTLQAEFAELLKAEAASKNDLITVFKELGYEIKL